MSGSSWEMVDSVSPLATAPAAVGSDDDSESDAMIRVFLEKAIVKLPGELNDTAPAATMSIPCPPSLHNLRPPLLLHKEQHNRRRWR